MIISMMKIVMIIIIINYGKANGENNNGDVGYCFYYNCNNTSNGNYNNY